MWQLIRDSELITASLASSVACVNVLVESDANSLLNTVVDTSEFARNCYTYEASTSNCTTMYSTSMEIKILYQYENSLKVTQKGEQH